MTQTQENLYTIIQQLEQYMNENDINHRFVGGVSYAGVFDENSVYSIDIHHARISFASHKPLSLLRADGTVKDIDIILFCTAPEKIKALNGYINSLRTQAEKEHKLFPLISIESAIYPNSGKRNKLLQFVTAIEIDGTEDFGQGSVALTFEDLSQRISWKTLEPWTIILDNGITYTVRNPIADHFAYFFRSPSGLKPKDEEKIVHLKKLAQEVVKKGKKANISYLSEDYYKPWERYTADLTHSTNPSTQTKAQLTRWYWQTVGTTFAHGKGKIGQLIARLANQFTGVKQG
ncbi:hypothetical protein HGA88_05545 [Candidatus Roizmanbacteria bacterium]|nr:hypothetical protein [Candidatus Roizmanbacteria bacterium]